MYTKSQKLVAEFIGTFALIFFGAGSICADQFLRSTGQAGLGPLGIALAHGLAIGLMVTAIGHISGGHLNPAVTIGFWVTKRLSTFDAILYWIAQLAGAVAAAYLLRTIVPLETWQNAALGTPELAHEFFRSYGMVLEAVMTFFLVFVVFATAVDERGAFNKIAGFAIGLTVTMDILMGGHGRAAHRRGDESRPRLRPCARCQPLGQSRRVLGRTSGRRISGGPTLRLPLPEKTLIPLATLSFRL